MGFCVDLTAFSFKFPTQHKRTSRDTHTKSTNVTQYPQTTLKGDVGEGVAAAMAARGRSLGTISLGESV
jgi:hypothetical protein